MSTRAQKAALAAQPEPMRALEKLIRANSYRHPHPVDIESDRQLVATLRELERGR